jgi:hypothetical protein
MWRTGILGFLAGVLGANGVPHFVRGITKESYPNLLGNSPVPNLVGGWAMLVLAAFLARRANLQRYPTLAGASVALGVLLMGLFHAGPGAFGRES